MRKGKVVKMVVEGVDKMDSMDGMDKGAGADQVDVVEMVRVVANPRLFRGCRGQVVVAGVAVSGVDPLLVSRAEYEAMRAVEVDGVQAVVLD